MPIIPTTRFNSIRINTGLDTKPNQLNINEIVAYNALISNEVTTTTPIKRIISDKIMQINEDLIKGNV